MIEKNKKTRKSFKKIEMSNVELLVQIFNYGCFLQPFLFSHFYDGRKLFFIKLHLLLILMLIDR